MIKPRVLVASVSPHGSTAGVARAVCDGFKAQGAEARLCSMSEDPDPGGFDRVVLGAPIRYDRWHRVAREYTRRHHDALSNMPVSAFFTCLTLSQDSAAAENQANDYARHVAMSLPGVAVDQVGQFAGALDYAKFTLPQRWLARAMMRVLRVQPGDYRDWSAIETWVAGQARAISFETERNAA